MAVRCNCRHPEFNFAPVMTLQLVILALTPQHSVSSITYHCTFRPGVGILCKYEFLRALVSCRFGETSMVTIPYKNIFERELPVPQLVLVTIAGPCLTCVRNVYLNKSHAHAGEVKHNDWKRKARLAKIVAFQEIINAAYVHKEHWGGWCWW